MRTKLQIDRRTFIKRAFVASTFGILVPKYSVEAAPPQVLEGFFQNPKTVGGGGTSGTPWVTANPSGSTRNNFGGCVGGQVLVGASSITVSALGLWVISGNTETVTVSLRNITGETVITSVAINTTGLSGWVYAAASATLSAATDYELWRTVTNGGDSWFDAFTPTTTVVASCVRLTFSSSCSTASTGALSQMYAGVNFKYTSP